MVHFKEGGKGNLFLKIWNHYPIGLTLVDLLAIGEFVFIILKFHDLGLKIDQPIWGAN